MQFLLLSKLKVLLFEYIIDEDDKIIFKKKKYFN